tara:strand:+ start:311 stop:553 length:243 start_codon:yes stop_codon:yes gene_type:complete
MFIEMKAVANIILFFVSRFFIVALIVKDEDFDAKRLEGWVPSFKFERAVFFDELEGKACSLTGSTRSQRDLYRNKTWLPA